MKPPAQRVDAPPAAQRASLAGPARRASLAAASLAIAGALFHGSVASALVTRGDDALRAGDVGSAVRYYARSVRLDSRSVAAYDRLAFYLLMRRQPGDAARAYALTGSALRIAPDDAALLVDRGFAAQRLARWRDAELCFARAARRSGDPRYAHLAARMAQRRGDRAAMRNHLLAALALDGRYSPARVLLRRLGALRAARRPQR
ncbi:MAG TPA: hypothetical protein VFB22_01695 [Candidatus Baltobacteraceae bacterium]|nr:hypothetical protein [Candidatus Baltobacteraceae bacterium]